MERATLVQALKAVSPALAARDFVPLQTCFQFDGQRVWAEDGAVRMSHPLALDFKGALPGVLLLQLLESTRVDTVTLQTDGGEVLLTMGRTRVRLERLDCTWESTKDTGVSLPGSSEFVRAVQLAIPSAGFDPANVSRMGVTVAFSKQGVTFYATNNVTICKTFVASTRLPAKITGRCVQLSRTFCVALAQLAVKAAPERIMLNERSILTEIGDVQIKATLVEGADAQAYEGVLDGLEAVETVLPVSPALRRAVERAVIISPTAAELSYKEGFLCLHAQAQRVEGADRVKVDADHPEVTCRIAPTYLKTLLEDMEALTLTERCVVLSQGSTRRYIAAVS